MLTPLVTGGLALVAATSAGAALSARHAAATDLDARAGALHTLAARSLHASGRVGAAAEAAARAQRGSVHAGAAARPLPGGHAVQTRGDTRSYSWTETSRRGNERLTVALPAASVADATRNTLLVTLATGLALLLLTVAAVAGALRRAAVRPLRELAGVVERLTYGERLQPVPAGSRETAAVGAHLADVARRVTELESQATTDPLTGVGNRRGFQMALTTELKRATRDGRALTLVLIDLDGFKEINDANGHPFGDGVLQVVAEKLRAELRATDVLTRVGGDEFAILLPSTTRDRAEAFVDRARRAAAGAIGGVELTWCAGVAAFPADARDGETLMDCADVALYCAKAAGRSNVCHYSPEEGRSPGGDGDRAAVEMLLALPDGIVPVYQPLISLATGQVAGYEALARFPHPPARRPDEWFAIARRCGLGHELECRAVEAALAARGRPDGTFLAFNLSATVLMSEGVLACLPSDLHGIVIEITENERVREPEELAAWLEPLRERGARIAVDDAGAGYSGLQQVMRIRPDIIKLDRSLVASVDSDPAKAALIDSFVRFAARTGASICAEGVETPEELRVLADLDVTYGQGFGLARPAEPWTTEAPWVGAALRAYAAEPVTAHEAESLDGAEHRMAALTARLANVRSRDQLRGLATLMAAEIAADEVALLRRGGDAGALEAVTDHSWLPAGSPLALAYYPTLREVMASQEVWQAQATDDAADLGDLALLGRGGYGSMLVAPLVAHGGVVGLLVALSRDGAQRTQAEASRARIVGNQLGAVVDALSADAALV